MLVGASIVATNPVHPDVHRAPIAQQRLDWALAVAFGLLTISAIELATAAEPCNPAIDGTYCATQMPARRYNETLKSVTITPSPSLGSDLSYSNDQPVTFGAIVIGSGRRCGALFLRERCN